MDFVQSGFALFGKKWDVIHQYAIGMRKVSGFALFAIKSHRVCSFSKNDTEGSIRQKTGLIPEYPLHNSYDGNDYGH